MGAQTVERPSRTVRCSPFSNSGLLLSQLPDDKIAVLPNGVWPDRLTAGLTARNHRFLIHGLNLPRTAPPEALQVTQFSYLCDIGWHP